MKIVAVSIVRNEIDILGATARHLFDQGVDHLLITDHNSTDGTLELLRGLRREYANRIEITHDLRPHFYQKELTHDLGMRARQMGADWIVPFDADEFWCILGDLRRLLAGIPDDTLALAVQVYQHRDWNRRGLKPHPLPKLILRGAGCALWLAVGNHKTEPVCAPADAPMIQVREVPLRGADHFAKKMGARIATMLPDADVGEHVHYRACQGLTHDQMMDRWRAFQFEATVIDPIRSKFLHLADIDWPLPKETSTMAQGPTFPSRTKTADFHMLSHGGPVPTVKPLSAVLHRIDVPGSTGAQHNPCVFKLDDALFTTVRILHGMKTTNYIAEVGPDWKLRDPCLLTYDVPVGSIEDLRVFHWRKGLWAMAATHNGATPPTAIRQALLELRRGEERWSVAAAHVQPSSRHEKNWMPCPLDDWLKLVYSLDPLIVLDVSDTGQAFPSALTVPQSTGHIRGGSGVIPWGTTEWLAVVHQVHRPPRVEPNFNHLLGGWAPAALDPVAGGAPVVYLHRFAKFDVGLTSVRLGTPFFFKQIGIEFCAGLVKQGAGVVASFGVADKEAWLAEITAETVEATFLKEG